MLTIKVKIFKYFNLFLNVILTTLNNALKMASKSFKIDHMKALCKFRTWD